MGLKAAGADLAFKGGVLNGSRGVGLLSASETEFSGNAYARLSRALNQWTASGNGYVNTALWEFVQPAPGAWPAVSLWGLWPAASSGSLLLEYDHADTAAPQLGASVGFAAEAIGVRFGGRITQAGGRAACASGLVSGTRYLTVHSGAAAAGGNFVDEPVQISAGSWTADTINNTPGTSDGQKHRRLRNNAEVSFGAAVTNLPALMSVALRDGSNGANAGILWSSTFSTEDPALGDTLSFAANALSITLPID